LQSANGLWSKQVLDFLTTTTFSTLSKANGNLKYEEIVFCTLVGLKLLEDNFQETKA